jgi:hypothetical protein
MDFKLFGLTHQLGLLVVVLLLDSLMVYQVVKAVPLLKLTVLPILVLVLADQVELSETVVLV